MLREPSLGSQTGSSTMTNERGVTLEQATILRDAVREIFGYPKIGLIQLDFSALEARVMAQMPRLKHSPELFGYVYGCSPQTIGKALQA